MEAGLDVLTSMPHYSSNSQDKNQFPQTTGLWLPIGALPEAVLTWGTSGVVAFWQAVCDICTSVSPGPWRDCLQALEDGHDTSSIYLVKPENTNRLMQVWCDQRHDPGGWTVIQRRLDGSVNFFRNWETYKVRPSGACLHCSQVTGPPQGNKDEDRAIFADIRLVRTGSYPAYCQHLS